MPFLPDKPDKKNKIDKRFKLGTTSFIYPDHIIPNVKKLGGYFDEIELLVFESQPDEVLPSKDEIKELVYLSKKLDVSYNIHLPTDVSLSSGTKEESQIARDTLVNVIELFAPLAPTTYTLHLEMPAHIKADIGNKKIIQQWEGTTCQMLQALLSDLSGLPDSSLGFSGSPGLPDHPHGFEPGLISIETLDYPFSCIEKLVDELGLSVCIDAGHQIKYQYDLLKTFECHRLQTSIIHLHGVDFSTPDLKDHTALDMLPERHMINVLSILETYTGVVSLEVFNLKNLNRSLKFLSNELKGIEPEILHV